MGIQLIADVSYALSAMPSPSHHKNRRKQFLASINSPVLLMAGSWISRNYPANWSPFRADSNFLFFFPEPEANAAALFDPKDNSVTLFLDERTPSERSAVLFSSDVSVSSRSSRFVSRLPSNASALEVR